MAAILVATTAMVTVAAPVDTGWRQFQYGPSHTGYNPSETTLGPDTVGQIQRLWKTTIPGSYALTTPSVANGRVVVNGSSTQRIYALNATTGAREWSFPVAGYLHGPAAIVRGRVYQMSTDGIIYALDAWSGAVRWSISMQGAYTTSVTVTHGVVYAMGVYRVLAFEAETGTVLWNPEAPLGRSPPSVAGGRLYVTGGPGNVVAYDLGTQTQLWKRRHLTEGGPAIAVRKDRLYLGGSTDGVYALFARGGATAWHLDAGACFDTTPAVAEGVVYLAGCGALHAFDARTGAPLWSSRVNVTGGASPVSIANGVVWAGRADGRLLGFDATTADLLVSRTLDDDAASSVVVTSGVLYVTAGEAVYAYGLPG
jgi:outer membrane protein assembly factor BamB